MLHLFKAIVGTARIPQRIVRTTLCAVWRPSQPSHYNSRDLADELRRRQLSLSGQKGRDNLMTDMVISMATAPRADPADQSESDSDGSGATVGATSTSSDRMCAALETDILKDFGKPMRFDGSDDMWCEWVFTTRAWVLMSGLSTPELLQEVEERGSS